MASSIEVEPMDLMAEHLAALRSNVRKVFFQHETLSPEEELDRARRMEQFLAMGRSFNLEEREMIALMLREAFAVRRGCGCPGCRARVVA